MRLGSIVRPAAARLIGSILVAAASGLPAAAAAQARPPAGPPLLAADDLAPAVREYVAVGEPVVALKDVTVIDGTGAGPVAGRTVLVRDGRIAAVGPTGDVAIPAGARVLELAGHTVIPGLVGMHEHTYYFFGGRSIEMHYSSPRLFLGSGVTTIRTAGAQHPYQELNLKRAIDAGQAPGPRVHASGPYLVGMAGAGASAHAVPTEEDARRVVDYWAEEGVSWLKASGTITRAALGAVIREAHRNGIKVTGHLCSVTFREAAALGIDNLEHGFITNSDYVPGKRPDVCPPDNQVVQVELPAEGPEVQATYRDLLANDVAVTSTLSVYELFVPERAPIDPRVPAMLSDEARAQFERDRENLMARRGPVVPPLLLEKMMTWERGFVRAGGTLVAGVDPWGNGSLPGFGDQRNYELLVEAGFAPGEAVRIMTLNGAKVLGDAARYGSVEPGKLADLVVLSGDLARDPGVIRNVSLVFRDGVGYDPDKLLEDAKGQVGIR